MTAAGARAGGRHTYSLHGFQKGGGVVALPLLGVGDMRSTHTKVTEWLQIIRGEYAEIPDLALTRAEMRRMWALDEITCDALLDALVQAQFLRLSRGNRYVRCGAGAGEA